MSKSATCIVLVLLFLCAFALPQKPTYAKAPEQPDAKRVEELAHLLPKAPCGVGCTIDDRQAWEAIGKLSTSAGIIAKANKLLSQPMPELTDVLYLEYSKTGNRSHWQNVFFGRQRRLSTLVLAECIENKGRFLPAIEQAIRSTCADKTWVMPAHDRNMRNFKGLTNEIDLAVAGASWNLATANYWLGSKLERSTQKLIRNELERRTFQPFERMIKTGKPTLWWLTTTNNWNAVCLAGVTGSALATIESPERRAFFIAASEKYVQNFLHGFTPDGYCSEGIGYWNYGFGHFIMMAETIKRATEGEVDWMDNTTVERVAQFGHRMEIAPGIFPAFADCSLHAQPHSPLQAYIRWHYQPNRPSAKERCGLLLTKGPSTSLFEVGLFGFAHPTGKTAKEVASIPKAATHPLRDWFPDAGVLICRPSDGKEHSLAVALKGGHNAEHHNHNDVGTFLVALGGKIPLVDPGSETYTRRTFSSHRYESNVLNSFGHSVPRVAEKLQITGRHAAAKILSTQWTDQADTIVFDLRSAYPVKTLKKLERTFVFSRKGRGSLTVTDRVEFEKPEEFGIALVTFSKWKQLGANKLTIGEGPNMVQVTLDTKGGAINLLSEEIHEDLHGGMIPTRLGIDFQKPVIQATITVQIEPAS